MEQAECVGEGGGGGAAETDNEALWCVGAVVAVADPAQRRVAVGCGALHVEFGQLGGEGDGEV